MPAPREISPLQLSRLIGTADLPPLIDLRIPEDIADDPRYIPGARFHIHEDMDGLCADLAQRQAAKAIVYCQKGRKISQGVASLLRQRGIDAEVLEGGQFAWRDAGLPMVHASILTRPDGGPAPSRWVTRHRPKIDRITCPWLIRRFIDPDAEFLFVPPQDVEPVAARFGAIAFDIDGVSFSHQGEKCSFDAVLAEAGLTSPSLERLALVIRAADTNRHELAPQAAGLLAISVGLSRIHRDDHAMLEAGMTVYDALYRWARDGLDEGHDWPGTKVVS